MTDRNHTPADRTRRDVLKTGVGGAAALVVGSGTVGSAAAQSDCDATVGGGGDFTSIQAAVDAAAPGDTVCVAGGTYDGTLSVDVPDLTVRGVGSDTPTVTGGDTTTGAAVTLAADGVTFAGFEVTFPGGLLGIAVTPGTEGVTVRENHVTNVGPTGRLGVSGVIANAGQAGLRIVDNEITALEQSGFGNQAQGILLQPSDGDTVSEAEIVGNTIRDVTSEYASLGLTANAALEDTTIQGNTVTEIASEAVGAFDFSQGLNFTGDTDEVDVVRNRITAVDAETIVPEAVKIDGDGGGLTIRRNDLLAAIGLNNRNGEAGVPTVDARCNWWGSEDGPESAADNASADRDGVSDVVGAVTATPWLTGPFDEPGSACSGGRGGEGRGPPDDGDDDGPGRGPPDRSEDDEAEGEDDDGDRGRGPPDDGPGRGPPDGRGRGPP